jgi:hypothetical protein
MFAHNGIVINASCANVWNHLVQAQEWPKWCPFSGKVVIRDRSPILQKDTKFTWRGLDLPPDSGVGPFGLEYSPKERGLDAKVIECVPERGLG